MVNPVDHNVRPLPVPDRWCVRAYYTASPYAPDGSGRILMAGADLGSRLGEVLILSRDGQVLDRFGELPITAPWFHSGFCQEWSHDAQAVFYRYYDQGDQSRPRIARRDLATGRETVIPGDAENMPPPGTPILGGGQAMLCAAGHTDHTYHPEWAPVPFQERERHGIFEYTLDPPSERLRLSVAQVLEQHPQRDRLLAWDRDVRERMGPDDGLTLMLYSVRWNATGSRCLFYLGNHTVRGVRDEPRVGYIMTADRDLREMRLAVDLTLDRPGNHWSWHPDGEHVIGNGPDLDDEQKICIAQVRYDGTDYRRLSSYTGGGHPSVCPVDHNLLVTDTYRYPNGEVAFVDLERDRVIQRHTLPRATRELPGRHEYRCDHHPSFSRDGRRVLVNTLPGKHAVVYEMDTPLAAGS
jgi:hypothetical protein